MQNRHPMRIFCMAHETQQGLCIKLEGWNGERDRREVQKGGDICIPMADSQLFVRPPQIAILLFCISFLWEWS